MRGIVAAVVALGLAATAFAGNVAQFDILRTPDGSGVQQVDGANIITSTVPAEALTPSVQESLGKADAALQPGAEFDYTAISNPPWLETVPPQDYSIITNPPTIGSMAAEDAADYPKTNTLAPVAFSGDYGDLDNKPESGDVSGWSGEPSTQLISRVYSVDPGESVDYPQEGIPSSYSGGGWSAEGPDYTYSYPAGASTSSVVTFYDNFYEVEGESVVDVPNVLGGITLYWEHYVDSMSYSNIVGDLYVYFTFGSQTSDVISTSIPYDVGPPAPETFGGSTNLWGLDPDLITPADMSNVTVNAYIVLAADDAGVYKVSQYNDQAAKSTGGTLHAGTGESESFFGLNDDGDFEVKIGNQSRFPLLDLTGGRIIMTWANGTSTVYAVSEDLATTNKVGDFYGE